MPMNKPHIEFTPVDMKQGWHTPPGYPAGIKQKILASDLDEMKRLERPALFAMRPPPCCQRRSTACQLDEIGIHRSTRRTEQ